MENTCKIGIIVAMRSELEKLAGMMIAPEAKKIGAHEFTSGKLAGKDVILACCGVGKVNAAACTAEMIMHYAPAVIINTGVAGGLACGMRVGDIVVADGAVEHDLDYGELGDERGMIFFPDGRTEKLLAADKKTADTLYLAAQKAKLCVHRGTVASGDIFVSDSKIKQNIVDNFNAAACEMEGAAIAHVCRLFGTPFGILRSISDSANEDSGVDFPTFVKIAADNAASVIINYLDSVN
jgi:adenosylhomocysteine nucleosidase